MSWLPDALQSRIDDTQRRLAEMEAAAKAAARDAVSVVKEKAQSVADRATEALGTGAHYADDVGNAAKHAASNAASAARATITGATPTGVRLAQAARNGNAPAPAASSPLSEAKPQPTNPVPIEQWSDDFLHRSVVTQRKNVSELPPGPQREAAQHDLDAMEKVAHERLVAHAKENAEEKGEEPPPEKTWGEILRPAGAFLEGVGTGVVSGHLGPLGAVAQAGANAKVAADGTARDKYFYGLGQEVAGAYHIALGVEMIIGSGVGEAITGGAASAVAVPVAGVGVLEIVSGANMISGGNALAAKGTVSSSRPVVSKNPNDKVPAAFDDKHVLNGEIKYDKNGVPEASGFHLESPEAGGKARIVKGTATTPDSRGVYKARVEVKDPKSGLWVLKESESTFFPTGWDRSRVRKEVLEAYAHSTVDANGRWTGTSSSGMEIRGFVDRETKTRITSAFPETPQ